MRRRTATLAVAIATVVASIVLSGCEHIPENASRAAFCSAGEKFSALQKVPFARGKSAIDRLAAVGTPTGIDVAARSGFVELIDRMRSASDAVDFRNRTRTMDAAERSHLLALDTYIQGTCSNQVPLSASTADFCLAAKAYDATSVADFNKVRAAAKQLALVGTPDGIAANARLGFIELIARVENAYDGNDFTQQTTAMTPAAQANSASLSAYITKTCH